MIYVVGYENLYAVTSCGRVWSCRSKKFLKPFDNGCGYLFVTLCKDRKRKNMLLHRLIAEAYIPNPENLPQVNHKDEVKSHNWINNLEWCDAQYNINYGMRNAKIRHKIRCIETGEEFKSLSDCKKKMGFRGNHMSEHLRGIKGHSHVGGYHFERID